MSRMVWNRKVGGSLRFAGRLEIGLLGGTVQEDGDLVTDHTDENHDNHNRDQHPVPNSCMFSQR